MGCIDLDDKLQYEITIIYDEKELFIDSPKIMIDIQNKLYNLLIDYFEKISEFNKRLNTSGLYISECLDYRIINNFYNTSDEKYILSVRDLTINTVEKVYRLCVLMLDNNKFIDYFSTHLEYLHNCIKLKEYSIKNNNLYNDKIELLKYINNYLINKELELIYYTLYQIDQNGLDKKYFLEILKLWYLIKDDYYNDKMDVTSRRLDFLNFNSLKGGVQEISSFNYNKYRLIISLYNYIENKEIDLNKFSQENFADYIKPSFLDILNKNLDVNFVKNYLDINSMLTKFKNDAKKVLSKKLKDVNLEKKGHIQKSKIISEYKINFINDCKKKWKLGQNKLKQFLDYMEIPLSQIKNMRNMTFGQYTLYDKDWFINPYDSNIGYSRDSGKLFGDDQYISKFRYILNQIGSFTKLYNNKMDQEVNINELLD